jgi:hypothetical protein
MEQTESWSETSQLLVSRRFNGIPPKALARS